MSRLLNEGSRKPCTLNEGQHNTSHELASEGGAINKDELEKDENLQIYNKVGNIIPPELYTAFPNINKLQYLKLRENQSFMTKTLPICESCYLYFTSLNFKSGSNEVDKLLLLEDEVKLKGMGHLKPEVLKTRYDDTVFRIKDNEIGKYHRVRLLAKFINTELNLHAKKLEKNRLLEVNSSSFNVARGAIKLDALKGIKKAREDALNNPNNILNSMISNNKRVLPLYQEYREKTAELLGIRKGSHQNPDRLIKISSRLNSEKSQNALSQQPLESHHRNIKSLSIAEKLGFKTFYSSCCEEISTQPTNQSSKQISGHKSGSSRFKSFSKGISNAQMVGCEGSIFSAQATVESMQKKKQKSYRLIDLRRTQRQSFDDQFEMYSSRDPVN